MLNSIITCNKNEHLSSIANDMILDMLRVYDKQTNKNRELLDTALAICNWIMENPSYIDAEITILNKLQILKRTRNLNSDEKNMLNTLISKNTSLTTQIGTYILLDNNSKAKDIFNQLPEKTQRDAFLNYPICHFWN